MKRYFQTDTTAPAARYEQRMAREKTDSLVELTQVIDLDESDRQPSFPIEEPDPFE